MYLDKTGPNSQCPKMYTPTDIFTSCREVMNTGTMTSPYFDRQS